MIPALGVFSSSYLTSNFMNGGGSPAAWQKETTKAISRLDRVIRSASAAMAGLDGPRLRSGPLFGLGLERATGSTGAATPRDPGPGVRRSHEGPVREWANARPTRNASSSEAARKNQERAQFPTRATRDSLDRAAEVTTAANLRRAQPAKGAPVPASRGQRRAPATPVKTAASTRGPASAKAASSNRNGGAAGPASDTNRTLTNKLVRRTSDAFRRLALSSTERAPAGIALSTQWARTLNGATAPGELIENMAAPSVGVTSRANAHGDAKYGLLPQSRNLSGTHGSVETAQRASSIEASRGEPDGEAVLDRPLPGDGAARSEISSPLPRAAAAVIPSNSARLRSAETDSVDWDLAALSATISRILNEDARRHGIDV